MTKAEQKAFEIVISACTTFADILKTKPITKEDEHRIAQAALLIRAAAQTLQEN